MDRKSECECIEVTEDNFGELLTQGLHEAVAIERGEQKPERVSRRNITAASDAKSAPPPGSTEGESSNSGSG